MKKLILALLMVSLSVCGCGSSSAQPQAIAVTQKESGTTVTLHKDQVMTLSLQGNGSTGYVWELVPGVETILTQQGTPLFVADSNATGAGGTYTYSFKATATGTGTLKLIYHRPWETDATPLQTVEMTVLIGN